jgi:hypothetical protein
MNAIHLSEPPAEAKLWPDVSLLHPLCCVIRKVSITKAPILGLLYRELMMALTALSCASKRSIIE